MFTMLTAKAGVRADAAQAAATPEQLPPIAVDAAQASARTDEDQLAVHAAAPVAPSTAPPVQSTVSYTAASTPDVPGGGPSVGAIVVDSAGTAHVLDAAHDGPDAKATEPQHRHTASAGDASGPKRVPQATACSFAPGVGAVASLSSGPTDLSLVARVSGNLERGYSWMSDPHGWEQWRIHVLPNVVAVFWLLFVVGALSAYFYVLRLIPIFVFEYFENASKWELLAWKGAILVGVAAGAVVWCTNIYFWSGLGVSSLLLYGLSRL